MASTAHFCTKLGEKHKKWLVRKGMVYVLFVKLLKWMFVESHAYSHGIVFF